MHSAAAVPRTAAGSQGASVRGSSLIDPAAPAAWPASAIPAGYSSTCAYSGVRPFPVAPAAMMHAHAAYPTAAPADARTAKPGTFRAVRCPAANRPTTGSSVNPRGLRPKGPSGA